MGTGEVSAGAGEMSRRKKPRTLVSVEDGQATGGEPRGRSTSVSEHASCPAHASGSVASGDRTNSRTEDSRRARLRADPFGVSSRTTPLLASGVLPESRRTLTVTLRSLWNLLNLRVRFLTILCLTRGVTC